MGDLLHLALSAVTDPAGEVDDPPRQVGIYALEVYDHWLLGDEAVGHFLDVVERRRRDGGGLGRGRRLQGPDCSCRFGRDGPNRVRLWDLRQEGAGRSAGLGGCPGFGELGGRQRSTEDRFIAVILICLVGPQAQPHHELLHLHPIVRRRHQPTVGDGSERTGPIRADEDTGGP